MHLQYKAVSVENVRKNKYGYVADVQCEDTYGTKLAIAKDVFCRWYEGYKGFEFEACPENVVGEDANDEEWQEAESLCKNFPGYHCSNPEKLLSLLAERTT